MAGAAGARLRNAAGDAADDAHDATADDAAPRSTSLIVHRNPLRERVTTLQAEHQKLLELVARKKAQLQATQQKLQEASESFQRGIAPLREEAIRVSREIRALFLKFLSPESRLSKRDKKAVHAIFNQLKQGILADPESVAESAGADFPFAQGDSNGPPDSDAAEEANPWDDVHAGASSFPPPGASARGGGYSAAKPDAEAQSSLKAVFKKLALALHPDRATNQAERERRTQLFQEVTRAYEASDIARLLELEELWVESKRTQDTDSELSARVRHLTKANKELRRQLRLLQDEDRELRRTALGEVARHEAFEPNSDLAELIEELEQGVEELKGILEFCAAFDTGQLPLRDFLRGARVEPEHDEEEFDEALAVISELSHTHPEMLEALMGMMASTLFDPHADEPASKVPRARGAKNVRQPKLQKKARKKSRGKK